jgi:maleylacetoacetate isomerase/maleylpyruvate isomerase
VKLYTYWRSTASYRVRIALALKGIECEQVFVHLVRDGGEHRQEPFRTLNPQMRVPALELDDGTVLIQSLAILEYLEEVYPLPRLLPSEPIMRARVRGVASIIACDVHPLHNVGPLNHLRRLGQTEPTVLEWITSWVNQGLSAVEVIIGNNGFCFGTEPGLADVCLVPQIYAARRFSVSLEAYPRIVRVHELASQHPAFVAAHPSQQRDAE